MPLLYLALNHGGILRRLAHTRRGLQNCIMAHRLKSLRGFCPRHQPPRPSSELNRDQCRSLLRSPQNLARRQNCDAVPMLHLSAIDFSVLAARKCQPSGVLRPCNSSRGNCLAIILTARPSANRCRSTSVALDNAASAALWYN